MLVICTDCLGIKINPIHTSHSGLTLLVSQWYFQAEGSPIYFICRFQMFSMFKALWRKSTPQKKTFMGDFLLQVHHLAAISELGGAVITAFTWDVGHTGSAPCFGVRIWTRHSWDLKSYLLFPWGSNLTLDYWLSGVPVLVCFFTDKKTGLRLAPRDISWQRILSTSWRYKNTALIDKPLWAHLQHQQGKCGKSKPNPLPRHGAS